MSVARPLRRRSHVLVVVLAAALAASACNEAETPKADPPSSSSPAPDDTEVEKLAEVTLVDAGAAPRRVVGLTVEKGHTESSTIELTSTTEVDFMSAPPTTVPMTVPFTTTVVDATDAEVTTEVAYGRATVTGGGLDKASLAQVRKALAHLDGVTMRVVQDRTGRVLSRTTDTGDEAADLVERILEDVIGLGFVLAVPFPTEEIGVGARWKVASEVGIGGTRGSVASSYELTALTDGGYTVEAVSTQTAEPGDTLAGKVIDGRSTATGTARGRTGGLGPVLATSSSKGSTTVEIGGQRVRTTFQVELRAATR